MKHLLLSAMLVAGLVFSGNLKAQTADANAPVIVFEKDTLDYGTIAHNSNGDRTIKFTNTGKEPLVITEAHGSCGCTTPIWPHQPIQPGQTVDLKVHYATDRVGRFVKTVTITSNASNNSKIIFVIGNVLPDAPLPLQNTNTPSVAK